METRTRYNLDALEEVRDLIVREGRWKHNQNVWGSITKSDLDTSVDPVGGLIPACPTAACVAGWATIVAGGRMLFSPDEESWKGTIDSVTCLTATGQVRNISNYGQEVLGLTDKEASHLWVTGPVTRC